jgi:hypothetical protein
MNLHGICQEHNVLAECNEPIIAVVAVFFKSVSNISFDASSCFSIRRKFSATIDNCPGDELLTFAHIESVSGTKLIGAHHMLLRIPKRYVCQFPHANGRSSSTEFD